MSKMPGGDNRELEELFGKDPELFHVAELLQASSLVEPPLDPAFRSGLRRDLLREAWKTVERRPSFFGRFFSAPTLAWSAATIGVLLIAFVAFSVYFQPSNQNSTPVFVQPVGQKIEVKFNRPMDHASVESQLQIKPATRVSYEWQGNTLIVHPLAGLAGNVQYRVTVPKTVKAATGTSLGQTTTITFVPTPSPTPSPSGSPSPTPAGFAIVGARRLSGNAGGSFIGWSGSTIYFLSSSGELRAVGTDGQNERSLGVSGVSVAYLLPNGEAIAYVNSSGTAVVPTSGGTPVQLDPGSAVGFGFQAPSTVSSPTPSTTPSPSTTPVASPAASTASPSAAAGLVYVVGDKAFVVAPDGSHSQLASLGSAATSAYVTSDAGEILYSDSSGTLHDATVGGTESTWSVKPAGPVALAGKTVVFAGSDGVYTANLAGANAARIASYSALGLPDASTLAFAPRTSDSVLVATGSALYIARLDGSGVQKLSAREFAHPVWGPDGVAIAFQRHGSLWSASVEAPNTPPTIQEGDGVVSDFMQQRLNGNADGAKQYLDPKGQQAYGAGGPRLTFTQGPALHRYFIVMSQPVGAVTPSLRYVVRLVLAPSADSTNEVSQYDETLALIRDPQGRLVIDSAAAGPTFEVDKGPQVISVQASSSGLQVTVDSDLDPATVAGAFSVTDGSGNQVAVQATYQNRVVTITYSGATPGALYTLSVATGLKDFAGNPVGTSYSVQFVQPAS